MVEHVQKPPQNDESTVPGRPPRSMRLAAFASLAVLCSALWVGFDVNQAVGQTRNLNDVALPAGHLLVQIQSGMQECRDLAMYAGIARDAGREGAFQSRFDRAKSEVQTRLNLLAGLALPDSGKRKVDELRRNWQRYLDASPISGAAVQPLFEPVAVSIAGAHEAIDQLAANSARQLRRAFLQFGFELVVLLLGTLQMISTISANAHKRHVLESLKVMNQDLIAARSAAEESSKLKSEFLATVSHEIRTPMNGIIGMAELLSRTGLNEDQKSYNDTVRASAEALLTILNDILDFSRIEAGKLVIESTPFDVASPVYQMADLLAPAAEQKGLEFVVRIAPNVPKQLSGDGGRIRQVLMNLTGNAIKFTDSGHVLIEAEALRTENGCCHMRYAVHDTGIGIPEKALKNLFEKFIQADASTTRRYGGTGLGLAISRRLVELMGGTIKVDSEPGRGSIFSFEVSLPVFASTVAPPRASAAAAPELPRVLLVEPQEVSRRVLSEMLTSLGVEHRPVQSGEEAFALVQRHPSAWQALLVSSRVRSADTGTFVAIQRAIGKGGRIVLLVPNGRVDKRAWASNTRVPYVLTKPCRPEALEQMLALALKDQAAAPTKEEVLKQAAVSANLTQLSRSVFAESQSVPRARVLVAEDNMVNQTIVRRLLEQAGCHVDVAANGHQAVAHWEAGRYSLILMDCQMPELDGFEATREIRKREAGLEHVPIVAITANVLDKDRSQCFSAGMDDFLSKPLRLSQLQETVDRWTKGSGIVAVSL
jgi:two-component system, sensor histidine kinase and response regulator